MMATRRQMLGGLAGGLAAAPLRGQQDTDPWVQAAAIRARVRPPRFPERVFDVTRYGARPDGAAPATAALDAAIRACAAAGGGRVLVPEGRYRTGPIRLRSGVELHLARGAVLLFSTNPADYPLVPTRWEGVELMNYSPLVYAWNERNIAVTGAGTLDGQAGPDAWWSWKGPWEGTVSNGWRLGMPNQLAARKRLFDMAERGVPVAARVFGNGGYLRPPCIQVYGCRDVLIEGVSIRRSPFWQIHPVLSRNVTVRGVDLQGRGPNTDGCDPESCSDVVIEGTRFDCGDDCIAIKSGRNADGRRLARPTEDVVIRDCDFREGHAGICVGSEISGGVRRVFGEQCRMDSPDLWHALRFKNNAVRGGVLEDFHFRDIRVGRVARSAIQCDFNYEEGAAGRYRPVLDRVGVERLTVRETGRILDAQGLPGAPIRGLTLTDCRFDGVRDVSIVRHVEGLALTRVRVDGRRAAAL